MNTLNHTGSQVFNFSRFTALLKSYLIENGKTLAMYTAVFIAICVLVGAFIGYNFGSSSRLTDDPAASQMMMFMFITVTYSFCFSISGSFMFSSLQTRASRISTFMLPASLLEKYLVRFVVYFILFVVCYCIGICCAEGVRLLLSENRSWSIFTGFEDFIRLTKSVHFTGKFIGYSIGSVFASHALYTLGSALWPKHSFFKTFVLSMVVSIFVGLVIPSALVQNVISQEYFNNWWTIIGVYAWTILLYYLAWWRFRTTQIVQRFMSI